MAVIRLDRPFDGIEAPRALNVLGAFRDAISSALEIRYMPGRICLTLFVAFLAAEAVLMGRLWVQLSGGSISEGFFGTLYSWSNPLVAPFRGYEGTVPIRETSIFEFATLAAMEFYLVVTLAVIIVLLVVPRVLTFFITLLRGDFKLGEKKPRIVLAIDAIKMIESSRPVSAAGASAKPDRRGAAVQFRTRPTRGHRFSNHR